MELPPFSSGKTPAHMSSSANVGAPATPWMHHCQDKASANNAGDDAEPRRNCHAPDVAPAPCVLAQSVDLRMHKVW